MRSSSSTEEDWDENTSVYKEVAGPVRSPIEESFYESYIIQSRTAIDNLYASNVLSCQKHTKEVADLARQRKVKLSSMVQEQKRLVKRMAEIKLTQETVTKRQRTENEHKKGAKSDTLGINKPRTYTPRDNTLEKRTRTININDAHTPGRITPGSHRSITDVERLDLTETPGTDTAMGKNMAQTSRANLLLKSKTLYGDSLPPLTINNKTADTNKEQNVKSFTGFGLPGNNFSKSFNDLGEQSNTILPNISRKPSNEEPHEFPFVTRLPLNDHNDPYSVRVLVSRETGKAVRPRTTSWNEREFKSVISTKVKWVPRT